MLTDLLRSAIAERATGNVGVVLSGGLDSSTVSMLAPEPLPAFTGWYDAIGFDEREVGEIIEKRVATRHDRFASALGALPRARILIEASTESEWVARCLEGLGHEVIVADTNFAPMYASRTRRVKTDRRDAQALMDACRLGAYRPSHRVSETLRRVRALLAVRDNLVRTRVRQVQLLRALLRLEGLRPGPGAVANFARRLDEVDSPLWLQDLIAPVRTVMETLNRELADVDRTLVEVVGDNPVVQRLCTAPGIGPVTAVAFVSTLDDIALMFYGSANETLTKVTLSGCTIGLRRSVS